MDDHAGLCNPRPIIVVDLFQKTLDHLIELLSELSKEEWNAPTACTGWSVKDVALHLLGVEIGNISSRRDQYHMGGTISNWDELVGYINRWNQDWVNVSRRISAPLLIELLEFAGERANAYFQSLDPFRIGSAISWAGPKPRPVWLDIAREYTERWHHQQHIRDAVNRPGLKEPQYLRPVLGTFVWALPHTFRNVVAPDGTSITLAISGDSGGRWTLLQEKDGWHLYQGRPADPETEIALDQETAWRFFTKGMEKAAARNRITVQGDQHIAEPVFEMVSILA
jgi:uncharacterized protein (TIGR03083 family)